MLLNSDIGLCNYVGHITVAHINIKKYRKTNTANKLTEMKRGNE